MRRYLYNVLVSFDPASKFDWFLLFAMIYMAFLAFVVYGAPLEPPPPKDEFSPFG
jgi:hypothetical protein